ncbi:MAG: 1-deoxy-D-xylulose-5-phosphate reductoisomerase [Bacillota bacterium]
MKNLVILGSTGSIGEQALAVVSHLNTWNITALSCHSNITRLADQADRFRPEYLVVFNPSGGEDLKELLPADYKPEILSGREGYKQIAALPEADIVINAIVGAAGLEPSLQAVQAGHKIGLANKESLVIGGNLIMPQVNQGEAEILPIDSEHNAIFQLLQGKAGSEVDSLILTASGGPFRGYSAQELSEVTVADALNHPNWEMGSKITIDSATLMNKGLEVIEAYWLFACSYDKIKVIVHPESIIHSMVQLVDGSILAEMGPADMKIPIQYALTYPARQDSLGQKLDLAALGSLNFQEPDLKAFPALRLAYESGKKGEGYPVVLNAANEIAVQAFLDEKIKFKQIPEIIEDMLEAHSPQKLTDLSDVLALNQEVRVKTEEVIHKC